MGNINALIPARIGSKGIPNKNWRKLAGVSPVDRALRVCWEADIYPIISTDKEEHDWFGVTWEGNHPIRTLAAPAPLHTDTCPMIDVVTDALARVPGEPDDIWLLVQPTQPLREPKHLKAAIALLQESQADSVVSVVEVESPDKLVQVRDGKLWPWYAMDYDCEDWRRITERRQDGRTAYQRDGTVYAFRRATVQRWGTIYGNDARPLIIPASETQGLDTLEDWAEAERRIREREALTHR